MAMYSNPIIYADYSDPDPIRVGDDYYMVASSFTYLPGVPILHSRDLVHWELINYAVHSLPFEKYSSPSHGSGTWAPSIRYHNGEFFIFIPLVDEGIMVARSKDIRGRFSLSMLTHTKGWIDPCPIWTDDGKAYMVFAFAYSRSGKKNVIALIEIDNECTRTIGEYSIIFDGTEIAPTAEGPKAYSKDGYYYVLFPAGGVATGWQSCIRSRDIHGPYEYRVVMHQGSTDINGPHQGGWITDSSGASWFIHFQDVFELGRIIHLQPMEFTEDGWPIIGIDADGDGIGEPVSSWKSPVENAPCYSIPMSDEFNGRELSLQWQWQANPDKDNYSLSERDGFLRLFCRENKAGRENLLWYAANALTEIPQSKCFTIDSYVELSAEEDGDFASIGMIGHSYGYIAIASECGRYFIKAYAGNVIETTYEGKAEETLLYSAEIASHSAFLRVEVTEDKKYFLSYSIDGNEYMKIDHCFALARATWTGAKPMLWAGNRNSIKSMGYADFDYFRVK